MEVKANNNVDVAQRVAINQARPRPASVGLDTATFSRVAALDQALAETPVARAEAVARAKDLIGDVKYPPTDTINGIAMLLALKGADSGAES